MKFKSSHCFTNVDLFDNCNLQSLKLPKHMYKKENKNHRDTRKEYLASVYMYCLYLIILDIIENNVTFVLPLFGDQEACIYVKMFEDEKFQRMYSKGVFSGIDFLKSGFKGYRLYLQYTYKGGIREKPIYISNNLKNIFYENINNGKQYF